MKKLWISIVTLTASASLYALPVGNPWEASLHTDGVFCAGECPRLCDASSNWPNAWSIRLGFYGDFVFDRHMQISSSANHAHLHNTKINTQAGYWAFNVWDRIDLFGTIGATNIKFAAPRSTFSNPATINNYTILETDTHFSWSVGIRGTVWECGCLGVGAEAQYFRSKPHVNFAHNLGNQSLQYQPNNVDLSYKDWQVGLGASYRINMICQGTAFLPYIAVKYGRATMDLDNLAIPSFGNTTDRFSNLESDQNWGYAVGATLLGCNKISVTAEARFVSEKAFYINSQLRF